MASIYRGYDIEFRDGFYSWRDENGVGHNGYETERAAIDKHKKQLRTSSAGSPHAE
jgi:hypothetical protein